MFGTLNPKIPITRASDSTLKASARGLALNSTIVTSVRGADNYISFSPGTGSAYSYFNLYQAALDMASNGYLVPYTGASADVNLNVYKLISSDGSTGNYDYMYPSNTQFTVNYYPIDIGSASGTYSGGNGSYYDGGDGYLYESTYYNAIATINYNSGYIDTVTYHNGDTIYDITYYYSITGTESYLSYAGNKLSNGVQVYKDSASYAGYFSDASTSQSVYFCDGTYALNVAYGTAFFGGSIWMTTGNTCLINQSSPFNPAFSFEAYGICGFNNYNSGGGNDSIYFTDGNYVINAQSYGGAILQFGSGAFSLQYVNFESNGMGTFGYGGSVNAVLANTSSTRAGEFNEGTNIVYLCDNTNAITATGNVNVTGDVLIATDSDTLTLGAGSDMSIGYDGTDGKIDTSLVAPSDLKINCGTDKTIVLDESVWDDCLPYSVNPGTDLTALTSADYGTTGFKWYQFSNNVAANEEIQCFFQLPHSYKLGTDVSLHLHVVPPVNGSAGVEDVEFSLSYQWVSITGSYSSTNTTVASTVFRVGASDANKHLIWDFAHFSGTNKGISSDLMVRIKRLTKTADRVNDDYTNLVWLRYVDVHFEKDTIGSRQETVK